jgi:predicted dehydrogenase
MVSSCASASASFPLTRRRFLACTATLTAAAATGTALAGKSAPLRAAIIGHTGEGNYGHDLDLIFNDRPGIQVVAVADPVAAGRVKAAARSGALRQYEDYREMLRKEEPHLVCVAPRRTHEHHAMAMAALRAGAHLYMEKPVTRTLAEADELLATADRAGLRIAVAHQMRLAPNVLRLKEPLAGDAIGELLEIRTHGKQDPRAGGEDLVVLGGHLFDLTRFYAGNPLWCTARVLQSGHEITDADIRPATENIGPVAGDEIVAHFAFPAGVNVSFTSRGKNQGTAGPWGLEVIGSRGAFKIQMEMIPRIYELKSTPWKPEGQSGAWQIWQQDPTLGLAASGRGFPAANARVVDDWLAAIRENRAPVCSGEGAMRALEMSHAVLAAGLRRVRVHFPLQPRTHPLA